MDFWFLFKKIIALGLTPLTITIELAIVGLLLVRFSRRITSSNPGPKWIWFKGVSGDMGILMIGIACLFLYLCSTELVARGLNGSLEMKHPPIQVITSDPEFVVVLPGGHRYDNEKPACSDLSRKTFVRLIKGINYWKQYPDSFMVFTGLPEEVGPMKDVAVSMGVDPDKIIEETASRDTKDHPRYLRPVLEGKTFLLVTSGNHMPRAVALFEGQGLSPIPASTDVHRRLLSPSELSQFVPRASNLIATDEAFHEYLGLGWAALRRQLREHDARKARLQEERTEPIRSESEPERPRPELVRAIVDRGLADGR